VVLLVRVLQDGGDDGHPFFLLPVLFYVVRSYDTRSCLFFASFPLPYC
jgi:hypothetical protein